MGGTKKFREAIFVLLVSGWVFGREMYAIILCKYCEEKHLTCFKHKLATSVLSSFNHLFY